MHVSKRKLCLFLQSIQKYMSLEYCLSVLGSYFGTVFTPQFAVLMLMCTALLCLRNVFCRRIDSLGWRTPQGPRRWNPVQALGILFNFQLRCNPLHMPSAALGELAGTILLLTSMILEVCRLNLSQRMQVGWNT